MLEKRLNKSVEIAWEVCSMDAILVKTGVSRQIILMRIEMQFSEGISCIP